jgi:DNA-binding transcriptional LysR family regulator
MEDLNDIYFFASVVQYGGFSAAARIIGVEKTRLSRRIAALEKRLGVRFIAAHHSGAGSHGSRSAVL